MATTSRLEAIATNVTDTDSKAFNEALQSDFGEGGSFGGFLRSALGSFSVQPKDGHPADGP